MLLRIAVDIRIIIIIINIISPPPFFQKMHARSVFIYTLHDLRILGCDIKRVGISHFYYFKYNKYLLTGIFNKQFVEMYALCLYYI